MSVESNVTVDIRFTFYLQTLEYFQRLTNQNEYRNGEPIYHFDFYRLKNIDEAYDIGYEEYFYSGCWCFTEWTEKIEPLLPDHYVQI